MIDINIEYGKTFNMQFNPQKLEHISDNDLKIILKKLEMEYQHTTQTEFLMFASFPPTLHLNADRLQEEQGIFSVCEIPPSDFSICDLFIII